MTNHAVDFATPKAVANLRELLKKDKITAVDTRKIVESLNATPLLLNHLSLDEISKLSVLGVDLSRYVSEVQMNNIKVFVIKFASDSMMRVSKLITLLNKVEEKYYNAALNNQYMSPKMALDMIEKIQESITASVNLMMKLTDNETLMNLFVVNMNTINDEIAVNRQHGITDSIQILPLASRKKIDRLVVLFSNVLEAAETPIEAVEADFSEKETT